jgi:Tfp pilus assembly protein PilN
MIRHFRANSPPVFIEIRHSTLSWWRNSELQVWPIQRTPDGRLTESARQHLTAEWNRLNPNSTARVPAWCAIPSRGVSIRRWRVPVANDVELHRLIALKVETEFPLPADQLAWGYARLPAEPSTHASAGIDVVVGAVKHEILDDYTTLMQTWGLEPTFLPSAGIRRKLRPHPAADGAVVALEMDTTEWASFDTRGLLAVRTFPWGYRRWTLDPASTALHPDGVRNDLAQAIRSMPAPGPHPTGWVSTASPVLPSILATLQQFCPTWRGWFPLPTDSSHPEPTLLPAMLQDWQRKDTGDWLPLRRAGGIVAQPVTPHVPWKWLGRAAALLALVVLIPYGEALMLKPGLARRLAELKSHESRLAAIDQQWEFLRHLKQNQPPYVDALYVLTQALPSGTQIDSVSMNRRGDMVLRGLLRTPDEIVNFRSKLIASGFFAHVTVDERTPSPDRQGIQYRLTAQWKDAEERARLPALASSTLSAVTPPPSRTRP